MDPFSLCRFCRAYNKNRSSSPEYLRWLFGTPKLQVMRPHPPRTATSRQLLISVLLAAWLSVFSVQQAVASCGDYLHHSSYSYEDSIERPQNHNPNQTPARQDCHQGDCGRSNPGPPSESASPRFQFRKVLIVDVADLVLEDCLSSHWISPPGPNFLAVAKSPLLRPPIDNAC
ncbi:hypothetical protein SH501x_001104 [Pirellulaceae bacterium SH501]